MKEEFIIKNIIDQTGGIYYYDGWSAFTVLFDDAHIDPFEVVHIGDVNEDVISPLAAAGDTVEAKIEVKQK